MAESATQQHRESTIRVFRSGLILICLIMAMSSVRGQTESDTARPADEVPSDGFIELRETLIPGWYYRVDSSDWKTVGVSAASLRSVLYDDRELIQLMDEYKSGVTAARASYAVGGLMLFSAGSVWIATGDMKDWQTAFFIASGSLLLVGLILDGDAGNKLQRAVELHNRRRQREIDRQAFGFNDRADLLGNRLAGSPGMGAGVVLLRF